MLLQILHFYFYYLSKYLEKVSSFSTPDLVLSFCMELSLFLMAALALTSVIFHCPAKNGKRPPVDEISSSGVTNVGPDQQKKSKFLNTFATMRLFGCKFSDLPDLSLRTPILLIHFQENWCYD